MVTDRLGNKLAVGDKVIFRPPEGEIIGEIAECVGNILQNLKGEKTPARIKIEFSIMLRDMSGSNRFGVTKVYTPEPAKAAAGEA